MSVPAFFIPRLQTPKAAWDWYVHAVGLHDDEAEALYEIDYQHDGDRYGVRVGEPRHIYRERRDHAAGIGLAQDDAHGLQRRARS